MATDKRTGFYSLKDALKFSPDILMCIGQRGNGKTYSCLQYCLDYVKKNRGKQFMYIRRWGDDIKTANCQQLFAPFIEVVKKMFGENYEISYWQKKFFLKNVDTNEKEVIGHVACLSESHHQKSVSYPDVDIIFFDEFIQQSGERLLPNELDRWLSLLSTIIRFRQNVKIFMMANTVSKFTTYFSYYHIPINQMQKGDITVREFPNSSKSGKLVVVCEYADVAENISKETSKYIMDNTMILQGDWEIPEVNDIITAPGEKAHERLLFSVWDPEAQINVGCYVRYATWYTVKNVDFEQVEEPHVREFLVLRRNDKKSSYYHLTDVQDLGYNTWGSWSAMIKDIEECTGIDVMNELQHRRIYCDDQFTADYFNHAYIYYNSLKVRDYL